MQFVQSMPFTEALQKLGSKTPIVSEMTSAEWRDVPVALRERAFFSSQVESARFLQRAQDSIGDFLQGNQEEVRPGVFALKTGSRAHFVDQMQNFLRAEGVERGGGGLRDITSSTRLGLIFDVQIKQANGYGYWRQGMQSATLNEFPAMRFIRIQAVKEPRTSHSRYVGQVFLKIDPIWWLVINEDFHVPWGPWAWGCGHDVEDVDRKESEKLGLIQRGQRLEPVKKFFNENLQASTKGLAPELIEKLKKVFGSQIAIEGDTMRWTKDQSPTSKVPTPAPEEAPATAVTERALQPNKAPVSDALNVRVRGTLKTAIETAIGAIDEVHDDGALPELPVLNRFRRDARGYFRPIKTASGKTGQEIGINPKSQWPELTTVHEIGHFLDLDGIGAKGDYATRGRDPIMRDFLLAAAKTKRLQTLLQRLPNADWGDYRKITYLLDPAEVWARAYAQWVTQRSQNARLLTGLAELRSEDVEFTWDDDDFKGMADAIEQLFVKLGWL